MHAYPLWLLIFVILPLTVLWIIKFKELRQYKIVFFLAIIGSLIFSIPWDIIAVKEKIWYFKEPYIFGIWLLGLPLEEYLFIIFVTWLFSSITVLFWKKQGKKL